MHIKINDIAQAIEDIAPLALQEDYDNAGLLVGDRNAEAKAALLCLDVTEKVEDEAIAKNCNLIISHHPLIFKGLKSITGKNETERCVLKAIKNDIAIYAAHTNLDNSFTGVNAKIAEKLQLQNLQVLQAQENTLIKLVTFVPVKNSAEVLAAILDAGAGHIGNYDMCSYNLQGLGTFRALEGTNPHVGEIGKMHTEHEVRIETILPAYIKSKVISALIKAHPYEEPAFDIYPVQNLSKQSGAGIIGELANEIGETEFLQLLKQTFNIPCLKHSALTGKKIKKVALSGGSGSFLISQAISSKADVFITGDIKYHDYFLPENRLLMADIGHFESEQYTKEIFFDIIRKKFPTFVVNFSEVNSNPINYL
jgi:dinuclear metal center YbgI/SA1388 family protein